MVFECINIRQVPREVFKTGFQHLPWDLANDNAWKNMFDIIRPVILANT